jgi:universal stress protein E
MTALYVKKVLVAADSAGDIPLVERGLAVASPNAGTLTVISAVEGPAGYVPQAFSTNLKAEAIAAREKELHDLIDPFREQGAVIQTKVLGGSPVVEIIREVVSGGYDLLIVGRGDPGIVKEALVGSSAMHLIRKCPCPVWVVKSGTRPRLENVLAAVDPNPQEGPNIALGRSIIEIARSIARIDGAVLHIVHAWSVYGERILKGTMANVNYPDVQVLVQDTRREHRRMLDELVEQCDLGDVVCKKLLVKGQPNAVIPEVVRERNIDLVVIGTVSRSGIAGFLIGNVAEDLVRSIDCSVLALKPEGFVTPIKLDALSQ